MDRNSLKYKIYRALVSQRMIRRIGILLLVPLCFLIAWYFVAIHQCHQETEGIVSGIEADIDARFQFMERMVKLYTYCPPDERAGFRKDFFLKNEVENSRRVLHAQAYLVDADGKLIYDHGDFPDFMKYGKHWGILRDVEVGHRPRVIEVKYYHVREDDRIQLQLAVPFYEEGHFAGAMVCIIPKTAFQAIAKDFHAQFLIVDSYRKVFFESFYWLSNSLRSLPEDVSGDDHFTRLSENRFLFIDRKELFGGTLQVYNILYLNLYLVLFSLLTGLMVIALVPVQFFMKRRALRVADEITDNLEMIREAFVAVEAGDLSRTLDIRRGDEFDTIAASYNHMIEGIRHLLEVTRRQAEEMRYAQIRQLESQFNPHFLFNTLEIIRVLIRVDPKAAESVLLQLSDILRYSVRGEECVRLEEDIDYTLRYLEISKTRFGDRLEYTIDIDEEAEQAVIPKLLFQPIIENSVKYCMDRVESLSIDIRVKRAGEDIVIDIRDNGGGMDPEDFAVLERALRDAETSRTTIGLRNINRRIRLLYGDAYGVRIFNEDAGLHVHVALAMRGGDK